MGGADEAAVVGEATAVLDVALGLEVLDELHAAADNAAAPAIAASANRVLNNGPPKSSVVLTIGSTW
ncbi:hypothetical protein [Mycobacterium vicinigordonae]|uniref:hypothetical protein n=1 Tax=Mycobacterium vicinigordonae TaxID=1719132 RepID=UPI001FE5B388|nr:hypothetical protein [Mycobacterium vicinigordonae]